MLRIGLILTAIAVLLYLRAGRMNDAADWTPIQAPLSFATSGQTTRTFVADHRTTYIVEIDLKRRVPFDQLEKTVNHWPKAGKTGGGTIAAPSIAYSVLCEGRDVLQINTNPGSYWGQTVGITVGTFPGQVGKRYTVQAHVLKTAPSLQSLDPHLQVECDPADYKHAFIGASVAALMSYITLALGVILLTVHAVKTKRKQRLAPRSPAV